MRERDLEALARPSTTPRSSQCERPGGCVEMISSSGRNVRIASSIACSGSPSPISPSTSSPTERIDSRLRSSRACAAARASSSSEAQWRSGELSAGQTTSTLARWPPVRSCSSDLSSGPPTVSFATTRIRCSSGGLAAGACRTGASCSVRPKSHQSDAGGQDDEDDDAEPHAGSATRARSARSSRSSPRRTGTHRPRSGKGYASATRR